MLNPSLTTWWAAQLIDQVTFTRQPEYVFHHPLIRTVAYESQLKSDRAELHRRVAAAIEARDPSIGRRERGADRRAPGGRRRSACCVRLAYARRRHGRPTATLLRHGSVGSAPDRSPTHYPTMIRTGSRCASRRAPCCARTDWRVHADHLPVSASRSCASCAPPPGTRCRWPSAWSGLMAWHAHARPGARGVAAGVRSLGAHRVARRSDPDRRAVIRRCRRQGARPARWLTCCGGRRPSSNWPTAIPPKATSLSGSPLAVRAWRTRGIARCWFGPTWVARRLRRTALPWPAASTRCPTPGRRLRSTAWAICSWRAAARRCRDARHRGGAADRRASR